MTVNDFLWRKVTVDFAGLLDQVKVNRMWSDDRLKAGLQTDGERPARGS